MVEGYDGFDFLFCDEFCLTSEHSTDPDGDETIILREWDFDYDGTTFDVDYIGWDLCYNDFFDDDENGYPDPGIYNVTLRVTDDHGATDIANETLIITNSDPVAGLFPYGDQFTYLWCDYFTIEGWSESYDPDGCDDIAYYEWDLDYDGATFAAMIEGEHADELYDNDFDFDIDGNPDVGTYNVALRVTDHYGATNITNVTVNIMNNDPIAVIYAFSNYDFCDTIAIDGLISHDPDGCDSISYYEWDLYYDGTFDPDSNLDGLDSLDETDFPDLDSNYYPDVGTYNVALRVTDFNGATNITNMTIEITNTDPVADYDWWDAGYSTPGDYPVTFDAYGSNPYSYDPDTCDDIAEYRWDFDNDGDFDDGYGDYLTYHFTEYGPHTVGLEVEDYQGATNSIYYYDIYGYT